MKRQYTFEKGKIYTANIVLKGFQRLASESQVAEKITEALGMTVRARKVRPGEFIVSGIWNQPNKTVDLPEQVTAVQESG